jgi:conjugative transfer pilus assembly protein TraH
MIALKMFKRTGVAVAIGMAITFSVLAPIEAQANSSLRNEMQKMFGTMSNTTSPGVFETSRRGVISGGSVVARNKIMNTNIVSFQPPSFNSGCGGVDFYGGSFSFISKDQFVQLARTVASNAAGYAFYLAMDGMCPSCKAIIDNIQKKIQELNQFFSNSCQLAQGIVNDTGKAMGMQRYMDAATSKSFVGGFGDVFESFTSTTGSTPTENLPAAERKKIQGNIVWNALQDKGVAGWYTYGGTNLNLAIMTATGTVVIGEEKPSDANGKAAEIKAFPSGGITIRDISKGGSVQLASCNGDNVSCMNPTFNAGTTVNLKGFEEMVVEMLVGTGTNMGILGKMRNNINMSDPEKRFLANLPNSAGAMIFRLSRISEEVAKQFVIDISEPLGRDMSYELLEAFIESAITAVRNQQESAFTKEAHEVMKESREKLHREYVRLSMEGATLSDFMERYNSILQAAGQLGVTPSFGTASGTSR